MSEAAAGGAKSSNLIKMIVTVLIVVLVPSIGGIVAYKFYLAPAITPPTPVEGKAAEGGAAKNEETVKQEKKKTEKDNSPIPPKAVGFDLPEQQVAVKTEPDQPGAILVYTCALICENEEIKKEVEERKQWFIAAISKLYRNRTMAELNNEEIQQSILDQAKEECNAIMRRFAMEDPAKKKTAGEEKDEIVAVLSTKYSVFVP